MSGFSAFCKQLCMITRAKVAEEKSYKSSINPVFLIHICLKLVLALPIGHYGMKPGTEFLRTVRNWLANVIIITYYNTWSKMLTCYPSNC